MRLQRSHLVLGLLWVLVLCTTTQRIQASQPPTTPAVVMVCEHGAVKSLIAVLLFNQEAEERGLEVRAISRGIDPYPEVPSKIAQALKSDGFDFSDFEPQKLTSGEVSQSSRVVAIGSDLSAFQGDATSPILQWDDVPPASVDYAASKSSILAHVRALLDTLEAQPE